MMDDPPTMDPFLECQEQMRNFEINDRPPSFRHSKAFRNFKNPPQPHMCIRDMTAEGDEEVLINVMSWTRIVKPQTPNDPIPLYGGMRVLPSSNQRSPTSATAQQQNPAMLFAVMANPDVLKKASRNSLDDQDLNALVELMCEFVEAMNPGLKLLRQPVVLKDRDLSGELKNIWGAVQAKRETEREQFMTGKQHNPNLVVYTELGPESALGHAADLQDISDSGIENGHHSDDDRPQQNGDTEKVNGGGGGNSEHDNNNIDKNTSDHKSAPTESSISSNGIKSNNSNNSDPSSPCNNTERRNLNKLEGSCSGSSSEDGNPNANVPQGSTEETDSNGLTKERLQRQEEEKKANQEASQVVADPVVPLPKATQIPIPIQILNKSNSGKAEKEVANVIEKKKESKSISGFLHSGLFGKRNKDKDGTTAVVKEKSSKVNKLGSFKNKLLMSGSNNNNKEKEDKGTDASAKKIAQQLRAAVSDNETDSKFSEVAVGQSAVQAAK